MSKYRRVFSGIQPTGIMHLGNYLGAVRNWQAMQSASSSLLYCVVDLHAMTMPYKAADLHAASRLTTATIIASGIDTTKSIVFKQSSVREHTELCWLLSCITPLGNLSRMTQYKTKKGNERDGAPLALLSYPVLQAADILLYKATHVPVGEDQHQHLELARVIAENFNRRFCSNEAPCLPPPVTVSPEEAARIMSLKDASKKMSKSETDDFSRINLTDSAETIRDKIKKAKTDSIAGFGFDPVNRPEKSNLLTIFSAVTGRSMTDLCNSYATASALQFKEDLAEAIIAKVVPIGQEVEKLMKAPDHLDSLMQVGSDRARHIAAETMVDVRRLLPSSNGKRDEFRCCADSSPLPPNQPAWHALESPANK